MFKADRLILMGKIIIETICEGGSGGEAEVLVQARNLFPGTGGAILSEQLVVTASRRDYSGTPDSGKRIFFKHLILKKLDDFFSRTEVYNFPHIARPLGDENSCCFYEWIFGTDAFSWRMYEEHVQLNEWNEFTGAFGMAGIPMNLDVVVPDGEISQNIVHQLYLRDTNLNRFWKRIDFGERSLQIDFRKLDIFLDERKNALEAVLGTERNRLLGLSLKFLTHTISRKETAILDKLVRRYRISTLRHHRPNIIIV